MPSCAVHQIRDYQTPVTMRAFARFAVVIVLFMLGPYFAFLTGQHAEAPAVGYLLCAAVSLILCSLVSVQRRLENPFGEQLDDIDLRKTLTPTFWNDPDPGQTAAKQVLLQMLLEYQKEMDDGRLQRGLQLKNRRKREHLL